MTVAEILQRVKALSPAERKELAKAVIDMLDAPQATVQEQPTEHWGKSLNQLLDETGPIEMKYPEIEDPVEWVKHLRAEERRRLGDWGDEG